MMHLFLDASAASSGSGPTYVRNVVPHLMRRTDLRVTVLVSSQFRAEFQDSQNVSFQEFCDESGSPGARFLRAQRLIPSLVRRSGAEVLVSAGNLALFRSPVPQILLSGNALYTSERFFQDVIKRHHYALWLDTRLKAFLAKQSVRIAERTIAPSRSFAADLERWTGVAALTVYHGFDPGLFFRNGEKLPDELQSKLVRRGDELRLVFVSHYNYYRNFETLFRALPLIKKALPGRNVKLFLTCRLQPGANPGSYRPEAAAALAQSLGIRPDLVELGAVAYYLVHHVYRACDLYVSPAYVETFAHPLVEAMASGVPVVASDLPVHREICGDAAMYFSVFSPEALAGQIKTLAENPAIAEELSARGVKRSTDFSWKYHVQRLVEVAAGLANK